MRRPRGKCLTVFLVIIALTLIAGAAIFIGLSKKKTALAHFQEAYHNDISSIKIGFIKSAGALPIYSMLRLNSGTSMNAEPIAFPDYESMWEMMRSGNIEYCLAAAEEYALAVPRLKPGSIICALAEDSTNVVALAEPAPQSITKIIYARGLTGQAAAIKFCNSRQIAAKLIPVCEKDIPSIMNSREADAAVCDPLTAAKLSHVNIISGDYPVTICLVSSENRELEAENRAEFLLSRWFTIAKRLSINSNSAIKAIAEDAEMPQAEVSASLENLHVLTQEEALGKTQSLRPAIVSAINDWAFAGAFREPVKQKKYSEDSLVNLSYLKAFCKKNPSEHGYQESSKSQAGDANDMDDTADIGKRLATEGQVTATRPAQPPANIDNNWGQPNMESATHEPEYPAKDGRSSKQAKPESARQDGEPQSNWNGANQKEQTSPPASNDSFAVPLDEMNQPHKASEGYAPEEQNAPASEQPFETTEGTPDPEQ